MDPVLWTLVVVLVVLWLLGLITGVGAGYINLLLVAALGVLLFELLARRPSA